MAKPNAVRRRCALLLVLLALLLPGCGEEREAPVFLSLPVLEPLPEAEGLRLAVASDLHIDPREGERSAASSADRYSVELIRALLWDMLGQGVKLALLTGDLVSDGRPERHQALIALLREAEESGLSVYVLPGNHDLAPIGQREFAALYAAFGYDEAWSRDSASLSYCVMREREMLLMLDTAGYPPDAIDLPGAPPRADSEAFLSEQTLQWVERMLQEAAARDLQVLCAGHYNLLAGLERSGYRLENADRLAALLREYGVPLYLSGHLHQRAVYQQEGLTELVTENLLGYPTGYSVLDWSETGLRYRPRRVDVDAWAAESGESDPVLLHYAAWQQEKLYRYAVENVAYMAERNPIPDREKSRAADFFYAAMDAYWQGTLPERRGELEAMPGYQPFFRCAKGYAYEWWLKDLLENASPLLAGFELFSR